jgi:membrane protease YdiL (CAAX protease family)
MFSEMISPFIVASLYISCIKVADMIIGSNDRDHDRVVISRSVVLSLYAAAVAAIFDIHVFKADQLLRWTLKTSLIMVFPLLDSTRNLLQQQQLPHKSPLIMLRDYVIGPYLEEIVFRGTSTDYLSSSLCFSLAHLHQSLSVKESPAQLLVTFLFGLYARHVYVESGSVVTCAVVHGVCNFGGPPDPTIYRNWRVLLTQAILILIAVVI